MPNPSTYPYRRFPTIQAGAADHAARGTDAVKQELHALCAGSSKTVVTVECYPGTDQAEILALFPHAELIIHADDLAIQPAELDAKIEHELTDDPVFGIMTTWQMKNFYPEEALCAARGKIDAVTDGLVLVYGVGASLVERADITIYADITRWEIQLRFRKGQDNWHTAMHDLPQRAKYKRGYFAEWRWGDRIKDKLLPVFDYYLDTTSAGNPAIVPGAAYREALSKAAAQPFRMVPYFDPGVWGGDWMKTHFDLPENGSNYAWSFDGVPEENSLLLDFGSCVVETPALNLVYAHPRELLGDCVHARFGKEFPIRFDMLDTMHGQNLSLQVHPLTEYIQSHFHMHYTQDESYYLLDAAGEAPCVYLGIKAGTKPEEMIDALQTAQNGGKPFPAEKFVNKIAGNFAIDAGAAVNDRCAQGLLILPNHGIPADTAFFHNDPAADDGIILHSGIPHYGGVLADIGITSCNGVICKDCIAADNCIFTGDGIFRNPRAAIWVEVIAAFHIAAEHPGKDILGQVRHSPDAVQVGIVGMGNVGDLVFLHLASPRSRLGVGLGDSSVSTYSETMLSAFW